MASVLLGGHANIVHDQQLHHSKLSFPIKPQNKSTHTEFFMSMIMQTLIFDACNYLTVHDLSITNSPKSHIHVHGCKDATFSHINITAPADSPNTDGIDVTSSKNIVIQNSTIQSGKPKFSSSYENINFSIQCSKI